MLKFKKINKDRLFYDLYEFCVCLNIDEAGVLRNKTQKEFENFIQKRNKWRTTYNANRRVIDGKIYKDLQSAFDTLQQIREHVKIVISYNLIYVYSNDKDILTNLSTQSFFAFYSATQAVVSKPRNVVFKTNPKFRFRSYFKDYRLTSDQAIKILNFFGCRKEMYGYTKSLEEHLSKQKYPYVPRYLFVEHNDAKDITLLNLIMPGGIRKTVDVQAK